MSELIDTIKDDSEREILEKKTECLAKLRDLKKINLNLRGELGSYKTKAKVWVSDWHFNLKHILLKFFRNFLTADKYWQGVERSGGFGPLDCKV